MFSTTDELIAISKVIGQHGGIYASHIRGEGTGLVDSLQEVLKIGREAKLPVHVSHFKASGRQAWGSLHLGIELLEQARSEAFLLRRTSILMSRRVLRWRRPCCLIGFAKVDGLRLQNG